MKQYQDLIREIREDGDLSQNRTGVDTIKIDGAMMRFDLSAGFPAVTTKKLAFKSVVAELCAFLRASRSAVDFRALGCKVWDDNANGVGQVDADGKVVAPNPWLDNPFRKGPDDLGPIYGVQWREWPGYKFFDQPPSNAERDKMIKDGWEYLGPVGNYGNYDGELWHKQIDQLGECLRTIIKDPNNRRILFHGWNPAALDEVALPACHLLYQFLPNVTTGKLNMTIYVRSNDVDKGTPFNIAEAALFIEIFARLAGMKPGRLTYFVGDAHIYNTSDAYLDELLSKEPFPLPTLKIDDRIPSYDPTATGYTSHDDQIDHMVEWLRLIMPGDFELVDYQHHTLETPPAKMVI